MGALAVPRNAFLQPEAVVKCPEDHRAEVRVRVGERIALRATSGAVRAVGHGCGRLALPVSRLAMAQAMP